MKYTLTYIFKFRHIVRARIRYLTIILLLLTTAVIGQPSSGHGNGNGHNNPHPCNPSNPNCQPVNVPISGVWILMVGGTAYGVYRIIIRQRSLFKNSL